MAVQIVFAVQPSVFRDPVRDFTRTSQYDPSSPPTARGPMQHKAILAKAVIAGLIAVGSATTALAGDVGVAVNISAPGVYGQITIGGGLPTPELLLPQPTVVVPAPVVVGVAPPEPLYLHVPPGHERHWARHCQEYNACNRPVYFVSDRWYQNVYTPHHMHHEEEERREWEHRHEEERERHFDRDREHAYEHEHDHDHGHDHDHDHDRDHDH
jgi:hypothetical protein